MKLFPNYPALFLILATVATGQTTPPPANSAYVDADGMTHLTRLIPVPETVSPEAQAKLAKPTKSILTSGASISEQRARMDARQAKDAQDWLKLYPAIVTEATMATIPVHVVLPAQADPAKDDRVLLYIHGGGFRVDSDSLLGTIPIANLTQTKVISILYHLSPESPFPVALDEAVAVYKELLKTYRPEKIGIYGASAGAMLTGETAARIKQLGLPMPGVLGIFSGLGDFSKAGDSLALFSIQGLTGTVSPARGSGPLLPEYVGKTDPKDPILSVVYSDLHGLPPTLFITSTRDLLLSGTVVLHQAFLAAGVEAHLVVFDAQPHTFWFDVHLPEARNANAIMAQFFDAHLGK